MAEFHPSGRVLQSVCLAQFQAVQQTLYNRQMAQSGSVRMGETVKLNFELTEINVRSFGFDSDFEMQFECSWNCLDGF